jgi:hypothetical protein
MMMPSDQIKESVQNNDLKALIDATVSIDQYKSKIGKDSEIIVLAIKCMDEGPAGDLSQFLETGHKTLDVDVSPGPDQEGKYTVFVEMERDSEAFKKIKAMLEDIERVDNDIEDWMFTSYENKQPQEFNKETYQASVLDSPVKYETEHNPEAKEIAERMKFLNTY